MKAVVQRVSKASVKIKDEINSSIEKGIVVLLGIKNEDTTADSEYIIDKILNLRIFDDENGIMNKSLLEEGFEVMIISNFTIYGNTKKGRRPNYTEAARPEEAEKIYNSFLEIIKKKYPKIKTGVFREMMEVNIINDGPVTLILES